MRTEDPVEIVNGKSRICGNLVDVQSAFPIESVNIFDRIFYNLVVFHCIVFLS